ncbi:TonB-dependent receptor [Undibacterium flavidum]|uniref:TonB-dependent receptor n=1 Tax=Undibacterium flavidum TaxID=2762297 RepID=A0ABR6Y677_9BURK|nr:TonB-dependent receptor [Undibacterium flavidum]MBC3872114.1 TonB-dependent receptor [Undibacterium flavidum]
MATVFPFFSTAACATDDKKSAIDQQNRHDQIERVTIKADKPTTLPTEIPTTIEGINAKTLATTINAIDAEDALKYLPSLLVRKRYVGDYNHAVLATRASGTGNSARSMVFADGILLSNLLGNGASFTPRWGLVTPEEIQRVDVLYGPFSAAYSGNSVGAVVDYVTRMPEKFEAHAKLVGFSENFQEAGTDHRYSGKQLSASLGNKQGAFSWWANINRLDSNGHPIAFVNKLLSTGVPGTAGTPVTGAIPGKNPQGLDWWLIAATGQYHTIQDHAKIKLAYEITPMLRASYTFGVWRNTMNSTADTYLRDAAGNPVYSGDVNIAGKKYTLSPVDITNTKNQPIDISNSKNQLEHVTHGLNVKSNTKGEWDWELAASLYDYQRDIARAPTVAIPVANTGGAGRITDGSGTAWNTLALKGIWRPNSQHMAEFGYQREAYKLRTLVSDTTDWMNAAATKRFSAFQGNSELNSFYIQDAWRINTDWKSIFGGRFEQWSAHDGALSNATSTVPFAKRDESYFSPKAALAYRANDELSLKASLGRAIRMPTVSELYQGTISTQTIINNDPNLKPEKSWTSEWSAEHSLDNGKGLLRVTYFHEDTIDALYSQTNTLVTPTITNIQNVDKIRTNGLEIAYQASDVGILGLDLASSITYANSKIVKNDKFLKSVGKWQPRVPEWRANLVASYRHSDQLSTTLGVRYSGRQYGSLDNSDINEFTYTGVSRFIVADLRVRYKIDKQWSTAIGVDNLNNKKYWAFHPYTQRSVVAELKFDY